MRYVINKTPAAGSLQVIGKPTQVPSPWVVLNPPSTLIPPVTIEYTPLGPEHITELYKFGPNYVWPPVTVNMGDFLSSKMEIGARGSALFRGYLTFDLSEVAMAPSTVSLILNASGDPETDMGTDISIQTFISAWGPTLETSDWGDLSSPTGDAVAGPFPGDTEFSFPIDPADLTLEAVNYLEIAITDESISGEGAGVDRTVQFIDVNVLPRLYLTW